MLSKGAFPGAPLVCCDCGSPVDSAKRMGEKTHRLSGLLLGSMGGFVLLLAFLTGIRSQDSEQPQGELSIEKINAIKTTSTTRK